MVRLENKEKIDEIVLSRRVMPFCPLGEDLYIADVTIQIEPYLYYPEYIEITECLDKFNGARLTIEQLCDAVFNIIDEYEPNYLKVEITGESKRHLPVKVKKVK